MMLHEPLLETWAPWALTLQAKAAVYFVVIAGVLGSGYLAERRRKAAAEAGEPRPGGL
jgi:hypothetical protein